MLKKCTVGSNGRAFKSVEIYSSLKLGSGAFSEVFLASCDGSPCAAKLLQDHTEAEIEADSPHGSSLESNNLFHSHHDPKLSGEPLLDSNRRHCDCQDPKLSHESLLDSNRLLDRSRQPCDHQDSENSLLHGNRFLKTGLPSDCQDPKLSHESLLDVLNRSRKPGNHHDSLLDGSRFPKTELPCDCQDPTVSHGSFLEGNEFPSDHKDTRIANLERNKLHPEAKLSQGFRARQTRKVPTECLIMKELRHPCIIQYLGLVVDPASGQLAMLMELATENLTRFLHHTPSSWQHQLVIARDIASALAYLHQNHVLHRDLSSNNILMTSRANAKVSDFGAAIVLEQESKPHPVPSSRTRPSVTTRPHPLAGPLAALPGTMEYMPPEAFSHGNQLPVHYAYPLDVFSLGVLTVQICTGKYPKPRPLFRLKDTKEETAVTQWRQVPELERRSSHIKLIDSHHPLLPLATDCLREDTALRPTAEQMCQRIKGILVKREEMKEKCQDSMSSSIKRTPPLGSEDDSDGYCTTSSSSTSSSGEDDSD